MTDQMRFIEKTRQAILEFGEVVLRWDYEDEEGQYCGQFKMTDSLLEVLDVLRDKSVTYVETHPHIGKYPEEYSKFKTSCEL